MRLSIKEKLKKLLKNKMSAQKKTKQILKQMSKANYYSASHKKTNDQREETL